MTVQREKKTTQLDLPGDAVVVADEALPESILDGFENPVTVTAGESLKTLESVGNLAERILGRRSSKPMTIVAVGGGSVGDALGFLASVLWRGVGLWHVPTTLLAMVDSAHGGKTAVNLGSAKNQLGTFYPAERVVLVDECLETLPLAQRRDGLVELIKGLWIGAPEAFEQIERDGGMGELASAPFEQVGERLMGVLRDAIEVKQDVVDRDPREERGIRTVLNLGHTVAHALELETGASHGQAVAWGLLACSFLSEDSAGLSAAEAERLRRHVYPLIEPNTTVMQFEDRETFRDVLSRDKKRVRGELRSVLLEGAGEPAVTTQPTADDWMDGLRRAAEWYRGSPVVVTHRAPRETTLELSASKSELNRALVIRHLRGAATRVVGESRADDVRNLRRGLETLENDSGPVEISCGEGGTTLRFLLAVAAMRETSTTIIPEPRLLERPHGPLIDALAGAGATVELVERRGRTAYRVDGWEDWPDVIRVDASKSSQFASAVALLAATGRSFELEISDGSEESEKGEMPSRPYFDMTLDFLRRVGVGVEECGNRIAFSAGTQFDEPVTLRAEADASSAAVWSVADFLGCEVTVENRPVSGRQPDAGIDRLLEDVPLDAQETFEGPVELDVGESPDLVPVLTVAALRSTAEVRIRGAAHLRFKESDRIGDLAESLGSVGLEVIEKKDGFVIPRARQVPDPGAAWSTHGDHRLAMAGLLLALLTDEFRIEDPLVVTKSYPKLWQHARAAGWSIRPVS